MATLWWVFPENIMKNLHDCSHVRRKTCKKVNNRTFWLASPSQRWVCWFSVVFDAHFNYPLTNQKTFGLIPSTETKKVQLSDSFPGIIKSLLLFLAEEKSAQTEKHQQRICLHSVLNSEIFSHMPCRARYCTAEFWLALVVFLLVVDVWLLPRLSSIAAQGRYESGLSLEKCPLTSASSQVCQFGAQDFQDVCLSRGDAFCIAG